MKAVPWRSAAGAGVATLLASAPLGAIIQGWTWLGDAALAAAVVVALGLALHRLGSPAVVVGQCLGLLVLLDTATWDPADGRPGSADAAASALRNAGWTVAVAVAGSTPDRVWDAL